MMVLILNGRDGGACWLYFRLHLSKSNNLMFYILCFPVSFFTIRAEF